MRSCSVLPIARETSSFLLFQSIKHSNMRSITCYMVCSSTRHMACSLVDPIQCYATLVESALVADVSSHAGHKTTPSQNIVYLNPRISIDCNKHLKISIRISRIGLKFKAHRQSCSPKGSLTRSDMFLSEKAGGQEIDSTWGIFTYIPSLCGERDSRSKTSLFK